MRLWLPLLLLVGCDPANAVDGSFRGEVLDIKSWTMFHWTDGLLDNENNPLDVDRVAISFSETPDLCERQKEFLQTAADTDVPNPVQGDEHDEQAALFDEHFPVADHWDLTFWIGLPDGSDQLTDVEVDLAETFDDTWLNAEGLAMRWSDNPPGDLLTWRSDRWYDEYGDFWNARDGTVHIDRFVPGDGVTGSLFAVFEDDLGERAEVSIDFEIGNCFGE